MNQLSTMKLRGKLTLLGLTIIIWLSISSASVLVRLSGASAETCAFWRLLFSLIILFTLLKIKNNHGYTSGYTIHHFIAGFALAMHFLVWMHSLFLIPIYTSTLLVTLYPIYSLIIEVVVFSRKPRVIQVAGLILASILLGVYLGVSDIGFNLGVFEALLGGVFAAIYFVAGYHVRSRLKEPTTIYAIKVYSTATLITGVVSVASGVEIIPKSISTIVYLVLLAVIPMILGHTLMNYLLGKYPASIVSSISFGEPYGAGLLAYILLGESVSIQQLILGSIILLVVFTTIVKSSE